MFKPERIWILDYELNKYSKVKTNNCVPRLNVFFSYGLHRTWKKCYMAAQIPDEKYFVTVCKENSRMERITQEDFIRDMWCHLHSSFEKGQVTLAHSVNRCRTWQSLQRMMRWWASQSADTWPDLWHRSHGMLGHLWTSWSFPLQATHLGLRSGLLRESLPSAPEASFRSLVSICWIISSWPACLDPCPDGSSSSSSLDRATSEIWLPELYWLG